MASTAFQRRLVSNGRHTPALEGALARMTALYNEISSYPAAWLRNLIAAGHVAPGSVDERSIKDLTPADVAGNGQRHFFAGIGVWSHSLRCAGWPDDVPVWTGSCPCQPFSAAGRRRGTADERHLWPAWFKLINECRPAIILGEQVASPDGLAWLDAVRADLEGAGYAFGASDLCAAGVGAPHIRQRLYFVALADVQRREGIRVRLRERRPQPPLSVSNRGGSSQRVVDDDDEGLEGHTRYGADGTGRSLATRPTTATGVPERLGDGARDEHAQHRSGEVYREEAAHPAGFYNSDRTASPGHVERLVSPSRSGGGRDTGAIPCAEREGSRERQLFGRIANLVEPPGHVGGRHTDGFWRDAEWVLCRDGKARPIEPGTFPLANRPAQRMGRLHAYGNAIVAPLAQTFVESVMDTLVA